MMVLQQMLIVDNLLKKRKIWGEKNHWMQYGGWKRRANAWIAGGNGKLEQFNNLQRIGHILKWVTICNCWSKQYLKKQCQCNKTTIPLPLSQSLKSTDPFGPLNNAAISNPAVVSSIDKKCCVIPRHYRRFMPPALWWPHCSLPHNSNLLRCVASYCVWLISEDPIL